jgi:hypothetical protein
LQDCTDESRQSSKRRGDGPDMQRRRCAPMKFPRLAKRGDRKSLNDAAMRANGVAQPRPKMN